MILMKNLLSLLFFIYLSSGFLASQNDCTQEDDWRSLFNGINLDGWSITCRKEDEGKNFWKVNN